MVIYEQLNRVLEAREVLRAVFAAIIPKPREETPKTAHELQTGIKVDLIAANLKMLTSDENRYLICYLLALKPKLKFCIFCWHYFRLVVFNTFKLTEKLLKTDFLVFMEICVLQ